MTTNHTPGPWTITRRADGFSDAAVQIGLHAITLKHAHVREANADAALISAAPELLMSLQGLLRAIESGRQWQRPAEIVETWLDIASASIAKAEGRP